MSPSFSECSFFGYEFRAMWNTLVKRTIARFARGNISAQNARVQLIEERAREHGRALRIAERMSNRHRRISG